MVHRRLDLGGGGEVQRPADERIKSNGGEEAAEERTAAAMHSARLEGRNFTESHENFIRISSIL